MGDARRRSRLGLDEDRTVPAKLGRTFLMALVAAALLVPTVAARGDRMLRNWWVERGLAALIQAGWTFWGLALVYIWWRPRRLRSLYLLAEETTILLFCGLLGLFGAAVLVAGFAFLVAFVLSQVFGVPGLVD